MRRLSPPSRFWPCILPGERRIVFRKGRKRSTPFPLPFHFWIDCARTAPREAEEQAAIKIQSGHSRKPSATFFDPVGKTFALAKAGNSASRSTDHLRAKGGCRSNTH